MVDVDDRDLAVLASADDVVGGTLDVVVVVIKRERVSRCSLGSTR